MTGRAMREQAAVRVDRQFAAELNTAAFDEAAAFALGAEAKVFELDDDDRREAIVKLGDVYIFRRQSRHRKGALARLLGRRGGETPRLADVLVGVAFASTDHIDRS